MEPAEFFDYLKNKEMDFFCGVPDSLLKDFCAYVMNNVDSSHHVITANEGNAIGLAAGFHLATRRAGVVYLQNSGLGNCVNPLTSLTDKAIYSIPLLLIVGWRGEPGHKDEPQHVTQGRITPAMLDVLEIPYSILPSTITEASVVIDEAVASMKRDSKPYALLVRKGTFSEYKLKISIPKKYSLSREEAIGSVVSELGERDVVVSTTGMASRELFELRAKGGQGHSRDFLTVGSMGHASSIAAGIALQKPDRKVYCIDGDGAVIMHMGALACVGKLAPANFCHIILNNQSHDSVGGQPTAADVISFCDIAKACGYKMANTATTSSEIQKAIQLMHENLGPTLLEIRVNVGHRSDLGRPTRSTIENKEDFVEFLRNK